MVPAEVGFGLTDDTHVEASARYVSQEEEFFCGEGLYSGLKKSPKTFKNRECYQKQNKNSDTET